MLDEKRIAEIRERAERATAGHWRAGRPDMGTFVDGYESKWIYADTDDGTIYLAVSSGKEIEDWNQVMANALFIAHAREDVPAMLDEIARLRTIAENAQDCYVTEMAAHSRTRIELEAAKDDRCTRWKTATA